MLLQVSETSVMMAGLQPNGRLVSYFKCFIHTPRHSSAEFTFHPFLVLNCAFALEFREHRDHFQCYSQARPKGVV